MTATTDRVATAVAELLNAEQEARAAEEHAGSLADDPDAAADAVAQAEAVARFARLRAQAARNRLAKAQAARSGQNLAGPPPPPPHPDTAPRRATMYTTNDIITARTRLTEARKQASTLTRELTDALFAARAFNDPDLNAEALTRRRAEIADRAREEYRPKIAALRQQITSDAAAVTAWAESKRPTAEPDQVRLAWERVRMQLDAGIELRDVIATTSEVADLVALREMGPAWLNAKAATVGTHREFGEAYQAADASHLLRAVDARFGAVAGIASEMTDILNADVTQAATAPTLDYAEQLALGAVEPGSSRALEAAIASTLADQALPAAVA